jgi:cell division protein FtsQ
MTDETLKKTNKNRVIRPARLWPDRMKATLFLLFLLVFSASSIVILKNDLVNKKIDEVKNEILDYIGAQGFYLDDIIITGRNRTTLSEINSALNLSRGDNILKINVATIKHDLEELPWIRDVRVERNFFPNVLKIDIKEKEVLAIWQLNEKFYPLDMDGYVIEADYRPTQSMLLIVGAGASENILSLLKMVKENDAKFLNRIKVANYISQRRWNLILDDIRDGITVKLPEENQEAAWKKLLKLDETKGILKRKLTIIDLRLKDKVMVKLRKTVKKQTISEHEI